MKWQIKTFNKLLRVEYHHNSSLFSSVLRLELENCRCLCSVPVASVLIRDHDRERSMFPIPMLPVIKLVFKVPSSSPHENCDYFRRKAFKGYFTTNWDGRVRRQWIMDVAITKAPPISLWLSASFLCFSFLWKMPNGIKTDRLSRRNSQEAFRSGDLNPPQINPRYGIRLTACTYTSGWSAQERGNYSFWRFLHHFHA